jgi:hypothetical protein
MASRLACGRRAAEVKAMPGIWAERHQLLACVLKDVAYHGRLADVMAERVECLGR